MTRWYPIALVALILFAPVSLAAAPVPQDARREIVSVYFDAKGRSPRFTLAHRRVDSILNFLGLTVRHHNLRDGPPPEAVTANARGILAWFETDALSDPVGFIDWAERMARTGRKLVLSGTWAFRLDTSGKPVGLADINRLLGILGLESDGTWTQFTYDYRAIPVEKRIVPFEADVPSPLPPVQSVRSMAPTTAPVLILERKADEVSAVAVSLAPTGGYIGLDYAFKQGGNTTQLNWIIDPVEFLRRAFATDDLPKPDVTTLSGRRIYYSHIDGDGWNNLSEVKGDNGRPLLSAEAILAKVIGPQTDMPVTVGPVAGDLHPDWAGTPRARKVAADLLALPQVEAGSHTFTHPLYWAFYETYTPDQEAPYRKRYLHPASRTQRALNLLTGSPDQVLDAADEDEVRNGHAVPRSYLEQPFDLRQETEGAARYIETLMPAGKKVEVLQWSGDTTPFEGAIAATDEAGLPNLNGGDSRMDAEYPSLAWLAPVGLRVGDRIQVYSSNSNENTYTDLWTRRFFGYRYLLNTLRNTETPIRLKPANVYYHMYSGEKLASLNAVLANIGYARTTPIAPIAASRYARIGKGFFTTRLVALGPDRWRIEDRGGLQTIRFDRATFKSVDYARSMGVIGHTHYQGSLYVALDEAEPSPEIALAALDRADRMTAASRPYLVDSRWRTWGLRIAPEGGYAFTAQGFGLGEMRWKLPWHGKTDVVVRDSGGTILETQVAEGDAEETHKFTVGTSGLSPLTVHVAPVDRTDKK